MRQQTCRFLFHCGVLGVALGLSGVVFPLPSPAQQGKSECDEAVTLGNGEDEDWTADRLKKAQPFPMPTPDTEPEPLQDRPGAPEPGPATQAPGHVPSVELTPNPRNR